MSSASAVPSSTSAVMHAGTPAALLRSGERPLREDLGFVESAGAGHAGFLAGKILLDDVIYGRWHVDLQQT